MGEKNREKSLKDGKLVKDNVMEVELLSIWWLEDDVEHVVDRRRVYLFIIIPHLCSVVNVYRRLIMSSYDKCWLIDDRKDGDSWEICCVIEGKWDFLVREDVSGYNENYFFNWNFIQPPCRCFNWLKIGGGGGGG